MTWLAWSWRDLALCRQVVTADYDPFFSDDPEDQDDALALCAVCPAQGACLAYAIRGGVPLMVEKRGRGLPMTDPMRRG
jgi:Transcription factor WhiB